MYKGAKVAVVIPAYKEEQLVGETIKGIPEFVDLVIAIDDASPDKTFEVASKYASDRVIVISLPENQGVGGAIIAGHKIALENNCDISVVMAGDNQMDPQYLPTLLDPITSGEFDFAKGNRFFSSTSLKGMPFYRIVGNSLLGFLTKAASGYWNIFDPQNGYTAISSKMLKVIPLDKVAKRYDFENDLLIWLSIYDARITDVNIPARYGSETSHIKLLPFIFRTLRTLIRGFFRRTFHKS
jgi:glycosyltransferase involved in cell wall biosynthesis